MNTSRDISPNLNYENKLKIVQVIQILLDRSDWLCYIDAGVRMSQINNDGRGIDPLTDGPDSDHSNFSPHSSTEETKSNLGKEDLLGSRSIVYRIAAGIVTLILLTVVVLALKGFLSDENGVIQSAAVNKIEPEIVPTATLSVQPAQLDVFQEVAYTGGIPRLALLHTNIPTRPRKEVETYVVQEGDTVFGIAEKFGLRPQTILWGNYFTLLDNPAFLRPGDVLNILPVDGVYHRWTAGEGLNGVAGYYGVTPADIINYPANKLNPDDIGDLGNPNIKEGTWLIVPNGERDFITWSAPQISRTDPSVAKVLGPGACGPVDGGPVGVGMFIYPTNDHTLSGYDYSPATNHYGLDFNGETGDPIYAVDNGVIVYAGWNDWGYGYMLVIDHGNGWQTLYAHLSDYFVGCGAWVNQGQTIAAMGSTGRSTGSHLHFEMRNASGGFVNPWNYLP